MASTGGPTDSSPASGGGAGASSEDDAAGAVTTSPGAGGSGAGGTPGAASGLVTGAVSTGGGAGGTSGDSGAVGGAGGSVTGAGGNGGEGGGVGGVGGITATTGMQSTASTGAPTVSSGGSSSQSCVDSELLVDGGFEDGRNTWEKLHLKLNVAEDEHLVWPDTDVDLQAMGVAAHSGVSLAWFGADNDLEEALSQTVTIPEGTAELRLLGAYRINTEEVSQEDNDLVHAELVAGQTQVAWFGQWSNRDAVSNWVSFSLVADRLPATGAELTFRLYATTNDSALSDLWFDSLSLMARVCE